MRPIVSRVRRHDGRIPDRTTDGSGPVLVEDGASLSGSEQKSCTGLPVQLKQATAEAHKRLDRMIIEWEPFASLSRHSPTRALPGPSIARRPGNAGDDVDNVVRQLRVGGPVCPRRVTPGRATVGGPRRENTRTTCSEIFLVQRRIAEQPVATRARHVELAPGRHGSCGRRCGHHVRRVSEHVRSCHMGGAPGQTASVTVDSCDQEPIHIPGSIQPHAVLLVLQDDYVVQCSENASELLALEGPVTETVLGRRVDAVLGANTISSLLTDKSMDGRRIRSSRTTLPGGRVVDVTAVEQDPDGDAASRMRIVQIEPVVSRRHMRWIPNGLCCTRSISPRPTRRKRFWTVSTASRVRY